ARPRVLSQRRCLLDRRPCDRRNSWSSSELRHRPRIAGRLGARYSARRVAGSLFSTSRELIMRTTQRILFTLALVATALAVTAASAQQKGRGRGGVVCVGR